MTVLNGHFAEWLQFGLTEDDTYVSFYDDSILMTAFDICNRNESRVIRALRVDFTETSILMCDLGSASNLFDSKLNANDGDVVECRVPDNSSKALADLAAEWLSHEFSKYR